MTLPKEIEAEKFCVRLLEERLAAGMNILGPCHSVFRWEGAIREKEEWIILAQVPRDLFERFCEAVLKVHPYQVPCIISLPVASGHPDFLRWIAETGGTV